MNGPIDNDPLFQCTCCHSYDDRDNAVVKADGKLVCAECIVSERLIQSSQISPELLLVVAHVTILKLVEEAHAAGLPNTSNGYQMGVDFLNNMLPKFKHTRSGGCYVKLLDAKDEATGEIKTVYVSTVETATGEWVRSKAEFDDGRFVPVS